MKHIIISLTAIFLLSNCEKSTAKTINTETGKVIATQNKPTQTTPVIKKVESDAFKTATEGKSVQLVDVRTPKEYKEGHIENADNVNVFDANFMAQMAKYKKDEPVYVYCRSGGRSMKAARKLKDSGYNVVNLNGGFMGWTRKGFKAVK